MILNDDGSGGTSSVGNKDGGIRINRGVNIYGDTLPDVQMLYKEANESFTFEDTTSTLRGIITNAVKSTTGNLTLTSVNGVVEVSGTSAMKIPSGTSVQRPSSATIGEIRYNVDAATYEGYGENGWDQLGGGATGGGTDKVFFLNSQVIAQNYTVPLNKNAGTFGPVVVNSGVAVTVPDGSVWTVV